MKKIRHKIRLTMEGWFALAWALTLLLIAIFYNAAAWIMLAFWLAYVWARFESSR